MKKKTYLTLSILMLLSWISAPLRAAAGTGDTPETVPSPVIITEVQTGSISGSDEFIELYNASNSAVDITGWQLRYSNANSAGDGTTLIAEIASSDGLPVILAASGYYVVHTASVPLDSAVRGQVYSAKLSSADKTIGLFAGNTQTCQLEVTDAIAWGLGSRGEGQATPVSGTGERLFVRNRTAIPDVYSDTDNNLYDFTAAAAVKGELVPQVAKGATIGANNAIYVVAPATPAPGLASSLLPVIIEECDPPEEEPEQPPIEQSDTTPPAIIEPEDDEPKAGPAGPVMPARNAGLLAPQLSELLPNPAKPQTDAADEFVELYNSNASPFELSGFMLESGKKRYTFPQGTLLPAASFKAFFSSDTRLGLANTQGQVRLLDPFGRIVAQSDPYQSAKDGQAWVNAQGKWQWTTMPTPNATNAVKAPATKKKAAAAKVASASASKSGASQSTRKTETNDTLASTSTDTHTTPLHPGVLALVGVFAVLYGAYEYRGDVANKIYQLRSNRAARRENRKSAEGR